MRVSQSYQYPIVLEKQFNLSAFDQYILLLGEEKVSAQSFHVESGSLREILKSAATDVPAPHQRSTDVSIECTSNPGFFSSQKDSPKLHAVNWSTDVSIECCPNSDYRENGKII